MVDETRTQCAEKILDVLPAVMREVRAAVAGERRHGLSLTQYRVLRYLDVRPHLARELACLLDITPPSVTVLVDGLVERGLVERTVSASDRRQVPLQITPAGRAVWEEARRHALERLQLLTSHLSPDAAEALTHGLTELAALLPGTKR